MKIVIVGPANPYRGGIAMFNEVLAQNLQRQGHCVEIVNFSMQYPSFLFPGSTQYTDAHAPEGLAIHRMVNSINPMTWVSSVQFIVKKRVDVVVFRYWMPFMAPSLGTIARGLKKRGIRTVAITDNIVPHEHHFYDSVCTNYFLKGINRVVYMSRQVGEELDGFKFVGEKRFSPHPIYDIYGERVERGVACRALGLDERLRYVMFFGFIRDYKGLDLLLDAWKMYGDKTDKRLLIAGEFYGGREKYMEQIERLGLGDSIVLHDKYISEEMVRCYFSVADVVVQPYKTATQSGITQIAYHFGVPMIVTNVGGLAEIVPDGRVGYVVEREAVAVAEAIEKFYLGGVEQEFRANIETEKKRFEWSEFIKAVLE